MFIHAKSKLCVSSANMMMNSLAIKILNCLTLLQFPTIFLDHSTLPLLSSRLYWLYQIHLSVRIVFDDTEDIFADKITQQALLALNEATAAIMVSDASISIILYFTFRYLFIWNSSLPSRFKIFKFHLVLPFTTIILYLFLSYPKRYTLKDWPLTC